MRIVTDLHLHSKYARATSKLNVLEQFVSWCPRKGIDVLSVADFTHPLWFNEMKLKLEEIGDSGLYRLKNHPSPLKFVLSTEISLIWTQDKKVRKSHLLLFSPSIETVTKISAMFSRIGNINADGRPIFGLSAHDTVARILEIDPRAVVIPAHAWTPWFSVFGSKSGFDSLEEAFGDMTKHIFAIETGLSSSPPMNWRVESLDSVALVSFGDSHSLGNLMREATVFEMNEISFDSIMQAIKNSSPSALLVNSNPKSKIAYTVEFFPEEGKYHYDGHALCNIRFTPDQTKQNKGICPVCGKDLTIGVEYRVEELATRPVGYQPKKFIPYKSLVQLDQIIGESWGFGEKSKKVATEYMRLTDALGSEFSILLDLPFAQIKKYADERIAEGIRRVRAGEITIDPGYDGIFGTVAVFNDPDIKKQASLF